MAASKFNYVFFSISAVLALAVWGTGTIPQLSGAMSLVWICFLSFFLLTYLVSAFGLRFIDSGKSSSFMGVFFAGLVMKIIVAGTLILIYRKVYEMDNNWIVLPFSLIYFTYLIFETIILVKASHANRKS
jgi:uncharacterized membrane protein YhaH (DUF805 family)